MIMQANDTRSSSITTEEALVVDDDNDVRSLVCEMLKIMGFRTFSAANASDALATLDVHGSFDLLITDVQMPGSVNGAGLAALVKDLYPAMATVVITGFAGDSLSSIPKGTPVLWKPFRLTDLRRQIERLRLPSRSDTPR